jgi:hypothetical protein
LLRQLGELSSRDCLPGRPVVVTEFIWPSSLGKIEEKREENPHSLNKVANPKRREAGAAMDEKPSQGRAREPARQSGGYYYFHAPRLMYDHLSLKPAAHMVEPPYQAWVVSWRRFRRVAYLARLFAPVWLVTGSYGSLNEPNEILSSSSIVL